MTLKGQVGTRTKFRFKEEWKLNNSLENNFGTIV